MLENYGPSRWVFARLQLLVIVSMDDATLLARFEDCSLPFEQWTHRAHVKVAYLYLRRYPFDRVLVEMRAGIKKLNAAHHTPETKMRGYNETTTRAMLHLIAAVMAAYGKSHPVSDAESFVEMHPQLLSKHVLRFFYSPGRWTDERAKTEFVEPDLAPLPRIIEHG